MFENNNNPVLLIDAASSVNWTGPCDDGGVRWTTATLVCYFACTRLAAILQQKLLDDLILESKSHLL
ncbi:hypothetical protein DY000_02043650 [Brassica cretica]|uniref:Uncharacterized protein n=1 Tax=Brassica cretica TaxID=69181 RepID=A0ABQ7BHS3_BRACR|nr:hypothetical protein DY000_02043650 [Brassica cretica]